MSNGTVRIMKQKPEILAPAGDKDAFLAALAARADAIYLGLKQFSARMEAKNFGLSQLGRLVELAHMNNCKVYAAMNTLIKADELAKAAALINALTSQVGIDGLIIQDLALIKLARDAGFAGTLALSTLANISNPEALKAASPLGVNRVIVPRELSIDELRLMGENCPENLALECFVHGALCYCVSGRCYWSSYMGGKSGLRGRCVQPCRRLYAKNNEKKGKRLFACQDLELGALTKTLLDIPNLVSWKIEGRKKTAHYVYHTVTAYRLLRDLPQDSASKKMAFEILELALGRPGVKARFLPQKKYQPMSPEGQTASGRLAGLIHYQNENRPHIKARFDLQAQDYLRIGSEDERWHETFSISRPLPKGAALALKLERHKSPPAGTPVYLIDRRDPELKVILKEWTQKLEAVPMREIQEKPVKIILPQACGRVKLPDMLVERELNAQAKSKNLMSCLWLTPRTSISRTLLPKIGLWLPPVIWPDDEEKYTRIIKRLIQAGARNFICNAPWQRQFFDDISNLNLVAGPFCNLTNALALQTIRDMGFNAAFVSPELEKNSFLELPGHSPLPLGMVLGGFWPMGISRFGLVGINPLEAFKSPKEESFWTKEYGGNIWIFPAWPLNLEEKKEELLKSGYSFFAYLSEQEPPFEKRLRPGLFNWEGKLL